MSIDRYDSDNSNKHCAHTHTHAYTITDCVCSVLTLLVEKGRTFGL